jgi:fucose permease
VVKNNLSFVIIGIVGVSVLPIVAGWLRQRLAH